MGTFFECIDERSAFYDAEVRNGPQASKANMTTTEICRADQCKTSQDLAYPDVPLEIHKTSNGGSGESVLPTFTSNGSLGNPSPGHVNELCFLNRGTNRHGLANVNNGTACGAGEVALSLAVDTAGN